MTSGHACGSATASSSVSRASQKPPRAARSPAQITIDASARTTMSVSIAMLLEKPSVGVEVDRLTHRALGGCDSEVARVGSRRVHLNAKRFTVISPLRIVIDAD